MSKFLKIFACMVLAIITIVMFFLWINMAQQFFDFTHNGKYSGRYTVKECRVRYQTAEEAMKNCPNVEGIYFISRLFIYGIVGLASFIGSLHIISPKDE